MTDKTILVYDHGRFCSWAETLTRYFSRVLYFNPWQRAFPTSQASFMDNVEGVEKVMDFWKTVPDVDLFFFPDTYDGSLQWHLQEDGHAVWGSRCGDELEIERWKTRGLLSQLGLPTVPAVRLFGTVALREYLRRYDDKFVKLNLWRGDMETWHHENYDLSEPLLDKLDTRFGARKTELEFVVENPTPPAIEVGYDGWCIDGQFPPTAIQGYEVKDNGFFGAVMTEDDLPDALRIVNEKLGATLRAYGYRGFFSTELRITRSGEVYLIDPCCRAGSPPSEVMQELYNNWDDILLAGAQGDVVEPRASASFGVQVCLKSDWAERNWQAVRFPEDTARNVKLTSMSIVGGVREVAPQDVELSEIGYIVGTGDTLLDAIREVKKHSDVVRGFRIVPQLDALLDATQVINNAKAFGLNFPDVPTLKEVANAVL